MKNISFPELNFYKVKFKHAIAILSAFFLMAAKPLQAQVGCTPSVPTYIVDLTGNPAGSFTTPQVTRDGNCCGTLPPDRCIHFIITLDTGAVALNFQITSGAIPPGALYYQINCGVQTQVGEYICISGVGPHHLTFCKPGNNTNTYTVTSIAAPTFPYDDSVRVGCSTTFSVLGLTQASTTWKSIYPGAPGAYNSLLSCTSNCTSSTFTPVSAAPTYIDYVVCGAPIASNCISQVTFCDTFRVYVYPELIATISPNPATFCPGAPGAMLTATALGGLPPYSYTWKNSVGTVVGSSSTYLAASSGTYTVEIIDGLYPSCPIKTGSVNVSVSNVSLTPYSTNVNCYGQNTGTAGVNATGGSTPYIYSWSNGATTQNISGVAAGTYTVTVTDAGGCVKNATTTITQPNSAIASSISSSVNVSCFGGSDGSINFEVSGGTPPYNYQWNTGATTQDLTGLSSGNYTVTVTDANGCTSLTLAIAILQPDAPLAASASAVGNVSCNGGTNGSITLNVTGGTPPYSYNWNHGETTQNISGIPTGNYTVTITDAKACVFTTSAINVSQPAAALNSNVNSTTNISCNSGNNGSINLNVSGGTAPYSYSWSNGATTQNLNGISSGTYTVTVTDANACTHSTSAITITQPASALAGSASSTNNVSCFGGSNGAINLNISGGTAPYSYNWSNGATTQNISGIQSGSYSVTVTDANGCTHAINSVVISQPAAPMASTVSATSDVSCFSGNNGSINLNVSGGTIPYSFNWSNGATTQNISGLPAGSYTVTVTDVNGCTNSVAGVTISQPAAALSSSIGSTANVNCFGNATGNINLNISGGTPPYNYVWSNGATTQDLNNIVSGIYTVTATDAHGCTSITASVTISQPAAALSGNATTTQNVSCSSGANGAISLTVNGGTSPYSFSWSNGATTQNISTLFAGNYVVTVTDANGCTINASSAVTQPPGSLNSTINTSQNVSCNGGANGSVNLTVTDGTPPYSYAWSNGATTQDISGLSSGTYTVTVTDANGCINVNSAVVSQPVAALSTAISAQSNVSCFGGNNGSIDLTVNGGTAPYSYAWSNGSTSQDQSGLASGNYTVTVTDAHGCTIINSAITISQPAAALNGTVSASNSVSCFGGGNGSITLNITGGTSPYTFNWSNGASTQNISGLAAGSYTVTVTDVNGCTDVISGVTVSQPAAALNGSVSSTTSVSCFGGGNGGINLAVSGGSAPYSYNWSNGATTQNISGISSGTYTVTITDVNGCTTMVSGISVSQPAAALNGSVSSSGSVSCFGGNNGSINLSVNGGTSPYTYVWNNGATTQNISGVASGTYTVTVTDINGCTDVISGILVSQPAAALSGNVSSVSAVSCYGESNGSISLAVNGGTAPYTYLWNNGATTQNISGIASGTYTVTVTDVNGCTDVVSGITISQPAAALNGSVSSTTSVSCFGGGNGGINLNVNGGTAPYTYVWSNGATTQNISGVSAGTYTVTVTDVNGCTKMVSGITVSQPAATLSSNVSSTGSVSCFGGANGTISLNVSGGTAPYSYQWSNGSTTQNINGISSGTYTVTITDANGCTIINSGITISQPAAALSSNVSSTTSVSCFGGANGAVSLSVSGGTLPYSYLWNTGATTQNLSSVSSGIYTVIVTDVNGCTSSVSGIVIAQPVAALNSTVSSTASVSCFGGNNGVINLSVINGTAPYSFLWSNGATTQNISGLTSGTYTVTVTDANGCTTSISGVTINQPAAAISATATTTQNVSCNSGGNGTVTLTVSGGTSPYTFVWSTGATTQNIDSLYSGTYVVTITDAHGCTESASATVSQPPGALSSTINVSQNVNCFGGNNGSIYLLASGGTPPYTYNWSNGATTQNISNLSSGTYSVTITDANGCINLATAVVDQPIAPLVSSVQSTTAVNCFGGNNGAINLTVNGGTSPYSYNWSNGETTQNISNLASGTYTVTVTDINGCTTVVTGISINQPAAALSGSVSSLSAVLCFGGNSGAINLTVNGGTIPYTYLWNTGATTQNINNLVTGTYTVTITDDNGCTTEVTGININQPAAALNANAAATVNVSCFGGANGSIDLTATNGTAPYTYQWSNGQTTEDIGNLATGTYTVTVTDANGCTISISVFIGQPAAPLNATASVTQNVNCFGGSNGSIDLTAIDGTAPYTYVWSNGDTTEDINNLSAGTYTVTVTDANGCTFTISATINQPAGALNASINVTQNVSCFSGSNGSIDLTVTNGTPPYTFSWNNGATSEDITGLTSGTYTVMITDTNGCTTTATATIAQPAAALNASANITQNVSCFGGANGSIDLTATNGTPPYTFVWSNGATTEDINNLSTGTYTVTVTDANGCTTVVTGTISQPAAALNASVNIIQNVSCFGGANGSISLIVNGGTGPYTFNWSNGATTQDLISASSGTYTVTITDTNGCTTVVTGTISQPVAALNANLSVTQNVNCNAGSDGSINLTVTGGTGPYTFNWSNGATTEDLINLSAGTYTVTVIDTNGCTTVSSATVSQPLNALSATASPSQNVSCFGGSNGTITLTVSGGTGPYTFNWSNGATTQDLINLSSGTYTVTVTDANGCTQIATATITQPTATVTVSGSGSSSNCLTQQPGSVTINPNGGTAPYTYNWSNGATTQNLSNVSTGTYTVTITDALGCTTSGTYTVTDLSVFNANANGPTEICMGELVTLVADSFPVTTYQWYLNGQVLGGATYNVFVTPAPGSYTVIISNACGTFVSDTIVVKVHTIDNVTTSGSVIICTGESTQLNATGGVSYEWTPVDGLDYTNVPNPIASPLVTTLYTVTVTNQFGCKTTGTVEVTVMCDTLIIPSGFSPNGDGINDGFEIVGIEDYPGNKIWIYNRWGNLIFKTHDYANNWSGQSNVSGLYIGKKVPAGTYFYILDLNTNSKPLQGYIVLRY